MRNVFLDVYELLLDSVDSSAAEAFLAHISESISDIGDIENTYTVDKQMRWLSLYWISQLKEYTITETYCYEFNLIACNTPDEFMKVFNATVVPVLNGVHSLPDLSLPLPRL